MAYSRRFSLALSGPTLCARALHRRHWRLALAGQRGSPPRRPFSREAELEVEGHLVVKERLERNILRAGLRVLKGDREALERNVRDRDVDVDLEKLVYFVHVVYVLLVYGLGVWDYGNGFSTVSAPDRVH